MHICRLPWVLGTLARLGLRPLTPTDLDALLDRAQDETRPWRQRFRALRQYALLTQPPDRLEAILSAIQTTIEEL